MTYVLLAVLAAVLLTLQLTMLHHEGWIAYNAGLLVYSLFMAKRQP